MTTKFVVYSRTIRSSGARVMKRSGMYREHRLSKMSQGNMKGWTYILKCSDESYYVGSTNDLNRRMAEHQAGIGSEYTAKRLPVELVFSIEFARVDEAFYYEHKIKKWSRAKKEALIEGRYDDLPKPAKKVFIKDK